MHDPDKERAKQAGELLISFRDAAIQPLITAIHEETDDNIRLILTQFLIKTGSAAIPSLIATFKDPRVVIYSVAALGAIGEPAVPSLIALLHDPDDDLVNYAGISLARIGGSALPILLDLFRTDTQLRPLVSGILAEMGGVALPEILQEFKRLESRQEQGSEQGIALMSIILNISLTDTKQMHTLFAITDEEMVRMLTGLLVSKGNVVIDPIISSLLSWDKPIPTLVYKTFMSMKNPVVTRVHQVMEQLPGGDSRKIPLIHLLGTLTDPSSEPILSALVHAPDHQIRSAAIRELGKYGRVSLVHLTEAMQDQNILVRIAAVEAMGDIGIQALDQLLIALKDEHGEIRTAAIREIGKIGEPAKFMLIQALTDPDRLVRQDVVRLLDTISWEPKYTTDKLSYFYAKEDWEALVRIGPPSTDILVRGLQDKDGEISTACREALKKIRDSLPPA